MPASKLPTDVSGYAIFLDVDGTLIDIADAPDLVTVPAGLPGDLIRVRDAAEGALALVSGRSIETLDRLMKPAILVAAGLHGTEYRGPSGAIITVDPPPMLERLRPELAALVGRYPGAHLEDKGRAIAVHYRGAADAEDDIRRQVDVWADESGGTLTAQRGKMVIELKPAGAGKGAAVEWFLDAAPFAGRTPIAIGDDVTDEEMFEVVNRLGGLTYRVGPPDRPTEARGHLTSPDEVRAWLGNIR